MDLEAVEELRAGWLVDARRAKTAMQALRRLLEAHGQQDLHLCDAAELARRADSVIAQIHAARDGDCAPDRQARCRRP